MKHVLPGYEKRKIAIDVYKHFATLAVACIAVIITFLPQLKELEQSKTLLMLAVLCFLFCVISTVINILITLSNIEGLPDIQGTFQHKLHFLSSVGVIVGFPLGVIALCILIISNLV